MAAPQLYFAVDNFGVNAAAAMAEIRIVLSRLTPDERATFWNAVDLLYRAPFGSSISTKGTRPIQNGVAQGLKTLFPFL